MLVSAFSFAQTNTENYTTETIYQNGRNPSGFYFATNTDFVTTTYYDGLGRPIQQVQQNASPVGDKNIVTHIEYEKNLGQTKNYLSFTTEGKEVTSFPGGVTSTSYNSNYTTDAKQSTHNYYNAIHGAPNPYSENRLEASPNARVLETGAPGNDWMINSAVAEADRHTIRYNYTFNTTNEVKKYLVNTQWNSSREVFTNTIDENGYYPANTLKKTTVKNENWKADDGVNNTTEEFTGVDGKVLLKRTYNNNEAHDTYYAYDFYGNLAYVVPPLANGSVAVTNLNELCYQYLYDEKNRLVEKKLPQKQWEYIVYDKADRIVMTGPANNPFDTYAEPGWIMTKYDNQSRTLYTGFYNGHMVNSENRKEIKESIYAQADNNETKSTSNTTIDGVTTRYTNTKFPTAFNLLTVNYYDDYQFPSAPSSFPAVQGVTTVAAVKGLATGSWTRVITTDDEHKANVSHTLYNNKYQPVRTYTANYLGGYIQTDNVLPFRGIPTQTITTNKKDAAAAVLTVTNNFTYDLRERLRTHNQQINGGSAKLIAENIYDELGKLIIKKVGGTSAVPLQDIAYGYNIRGWLRSINQIENTVGPSTNKLFNYTVNYNQTFNEDTSQPQYNGNISSVAWRTLTDNQIKGYGYDYDHLNRLNYASHLTSTGNYSYRNYNRDGQYAEDLTYDKNGNILTLQRYGQEENGQPIQTDDLTYEYTANQLQTVTDATNNPDGFNDGNTVGLDYIYDTFGNLKADSNKEIEDITYNHLNLPVEITFATGKITYTYDATGTKIKKVVEPATGAAQTTDYLFGFEYENGVLQTFPHAEGYVKNNGGNYVYHYIYKDHLGNNRLVYADLNNDGTINPATEIVEENNYYPFGLKHQGYNNLPGDGYKYKFLNKEYEDSFALNVTETDFRHYDSALGRFNVMDVLSELAPNFTPYRYGFNNPVFWSDPSGLFESYDAAQNWIDRWGLSGASISYNQDKGLYEIENNGVSFYQRGVDIIKSMYSLDTGITIDIIKGGASNGGGGKKSGMGAKLSADLTNSYSSSGLRHAVNWWSRNINLGIYDFLYNNSAVTGYGSGEYGPWIPDAFGVSFNASAWGSSVGFSMVLDNKDNFDWFVSYSGGAGYTGAGFSVGGTFDLYNNSDPTKTVLNGIPGSTYDFSTGYGFMGGYSTPFDPKSRQFINRGVDKYSFGIGTGARAGEGRTYSSGEMYQMIINYFNSFNR
ncbi:DUF6443 domain-containing protein [Paenimyroides ummariense]|uniref:DUF6443 domain-containing protein n=1 Tax=Paenimyroides ummariense TaxID=913024 RepID=UPI0015A67AEC|nr:DUF6443 domain-containing protein [Paenimyroides ummariense]